MLQKAGMVLILGGALTAVVYLFYLFFTSPTIAIALPFKIAIAVVLVGLLVLLISVGWERYRAAKREKFEEDR